MRVSSNLNLGFLSRIAKRSLAGSSAVCSDVQIMFGRGRERRLCGGSNSIDAWLDLLQQQGWLIQGWRLGKGEVRRSDKYYMER